MLYKFALCEVVPLNIDKGSLGLVKTASGSVFVEPNSEPARIIESEIKKHPTALFFRAKAIKADEPNSNGDYFSVEELLKAYKSFEGVPFFTNHDNQNVENARGKVIFAEWVPGEKAVYTISFVDREAYPHICRSIEEEYITGVSMGFLGMEADITMADLSSKKICEVNVGDQVLTPYGNVCGVEKIYSEIMASTMYELDLTTYHKSPLLSDNHPVYLIDAEEIKEQQKKSLTEAGKTNHLKRQGKVAKDAFCSQDGWRKGQYTPKFKETKDIVKGDYVLIPSKYRITPDEDYDNDFYYLCGAYLGDGYLATNKNKENSSLVYYIGLHEKKELGEKIRSLLPKYSSAKINVTPYELKNGLKINIYDQDIVDIIFSKFGKLAHEKRIYQKEFTKEQIYALVAGYIDTDGTVSKTYNKKLNGEIRGNGTRGALISSCNQKLLEDVQSLLILVDVPSYITWNYRLSNENSVVKVPTTEYSLFIPYSNLYLFGESIKLKNAEVAKAKISAGKVIIFTGDNNQKYMACPVKNIVQREYTKPCYDLKVEGDECYIADGVAVHNCSVEYSECNICGNRAESTEKYCSHIKERKGRKFSGKAKNVITGETKEFKNELVFEYNHNIKFIELSAVVDPACPSCKIQGLIKNDEIFKKVANIENSIYMYKTAAIEKNAGQQEVQQLNDVLKTLETLAVQLIQNRQQIEVEFASDLVNILSELQIFVDELVGAGYGNMQGVPGVGQPGAEGAPGQAPQLPPAGLPSDITEVGAQSPLPQGGQPIPAGQVGGITGAPTQPLVQSPKLPITAPAKPRRSFSDEKIVRVAANLKDLSEIIIRSGDENMAKRLTISAKNKQKAAASEILSNSWKEKQGFLEYINKVPSTQNNNCKLSVKKGDDSFIIVAENKNNQADQITWTFETLSDKEKELIKEDPRGSAMYFMDSFASNLKENIKEGDTIMSKITEAGAKSVNKAPEVITESQLDEKGLYHSRTDDEKNVVTESQLKEKRSDSEKEVVTERQLDEKRTNKEAEVITEAQLETKEGVSPRKDDPKNVITQSQLDDNGNRTGTEPEVITERQLDAIDTPWHRAAQRDAKMFKSAGDHMKSVISVVADTVISTGCTPDEACQVGSSLVSCTKDRFDLGNAILSKNDAEDVDYSKRLAYWSKKNIKVASVGSKEIAATIVKGLSKLASDTTINPEVIIDALDVVSESKEGAEAISKKVDEKLAAAAKETVKVSQKDELRKALSETVKGKEERDQERKSIMASADKSVRESERAEWSKKAEKKPDYMIETSFAELGCDSKDEPSFRSTIKSFAKGALAANNLKMAAVTNVTISGDTVSIAVQTNEGEEAVELPIGEEISPENTMPEGDISGEGLENTLGEAPAGAPMGAPAGAPMGAPAGGALPPPPPLAASSKITLKKIAQTPPGGQVPPVGAGPGQGTADPSKNLPGEAPTDQPVESLTTEDEEGMPDEIPTAGQQQPPWAICPECGSSDVDVEESGVGNKCNACGAEYDALVKKNIEFTIKKPTKSVGEDMATGEPEAPEVPALPVAAQTRLNKDVITRIASNKKLHGHVCPACGMKQCKASVEGEAHTEFTCPACNTSVEKDVIVNVKSPEESYLRVKWDLVPDVKKCAGCKEAVKKFASMLKVEGMIKTASGTKFPKANCIERIARQWGGNAVATFGPCKGKPLADCVCGQLETLGLTTVRHLQKLATAYTQKDPMDECVEDQMKQKYAKSEAETICKCLKKKFASKDDDNVFLTAFAEDIKSGKEKILTAQDLDSVNDMFSDKGPSDDEVTEVEEDVNIGAPLDEVPNLGGEETVTIEVSKETAQELASAAQAAAEEVEVEVELESTNATPEEVEFSGSATPDVAEKMFGEAGEAASSEEEKEMAMAMQTHKIIRVGEEIVKIAATPTKVESIEGNVEAKVPRSDQKLGEEAKADSLMNKELKKPEVPRKDAYMGKEKEADSMINKELKLPDVAVDSSYMGKNEKSNQSGMPAINNEIKGTVIAESVELTIKDGKVSKIAKKMPVIDTVEKEVESKVPRSDQKLGEESKADSLINEPNKEPKVPRKDAYMGDEKKADSLINETLTEPDVAIDNAYMGHEKEVQKGMPGISDKYLKNVQQKKDVQLERIAAARRMKSIEVSAKLLATKRIPEEAYDNVVEALSKFEIDKISSVADNMYPRIKRQAASEADKEVHAGTAIVMESKDIKTADSASEFQKRISSAFTVGNKSFDESLTHYGIK